MKPTTEQLKRWHDEWVHSAALQAEFPDQPYGPRGADVYAAFRASEHLTTDFGNGAVDGGDDSGPPTEAALQRLWAAPAVRASFDSEQVFRSYMSHRARCTDISVPQPEPPAAPAPSIARTAAPTVALSASPGAPRDLTATALDLDAMAQLLEVPVAGLRSPTARGVLRRAGIESMATPDGERWPRAAVERVAGDRAARDRLFVQVGLSLRESHHITAGGPVRFF